MLQCSPAADLVLDNFAGCHQLIMQALLPRTGQLLQGGPARLVAQGSGFALQRNAVLSVAESATTKLVAPYRPQIPSFAATKTSTAGRWALASKDQ